VIRYLTLSEVLMVHQDQLVRYGGDPGLRDATLLNSALGMPSGAFGGQEFHPSLFDKAAAYLFHLCQNHPFIDGNKRVGLAAALVFLDLNGVTVDDPLGELYELVIGVTAHRVDKRVISDTLERLASQQRH